MAPKNTPSLSVVANRSDWPHGGFVRLFPPEMNKLKHLTSNKRSTSSTLSENLNHTAHAMLKRRGEKHNIVSEGIPKRSTHVPLLSADV